MTGHAGEMNTGYSLVNVSDYQSAQGLWLQRHSKSLALNLSIRQ